MRKNAAFQRRNRRSNCCITVTPILFIMILFLIQKLVNSALDTPDTRVSGCTAAHLSHTHVIFQPPGVCPAMATCSAPDCRLPQMQCGCECLRCCNNSADGSEVSRC
jgi:hypothetical protein